MFPLTIGVQRFFFKDEIFESFKPFLSCGVGPSLIIRTPYVSDTVTRQQVEFFKSFKYANYYWRFGGFIGAGTNFGSIGKSFMSLNIRYYFIPFGGEGLESVQHSPLHDFGGLFLSLSIGSKY